MEVPSAECRNLSVPAFIWTTSGQILYRSLAGQIYILGSVKSKKKRNMILTINEE
jgi:hypothetical protein